MTPEFDVPARNHVLGIIIVLALLALSISIPSGKGIVTWIKVTQSSSTQ